LYHLLRCAAASRKLTKLHRSQQKAPQELFYRLAPSPVRIPVFITNKKTTPKSGFFIGSEGRIRTVDTRIMIPSALKQNQQVNNPDFSNFHFF